MIYFLHVEVLFMLIALVPLGFILKKDKKYFTSQFNKEILDKIQVKSHGFSQKTRNIFLLFTLAFIVISLARPVIDSNDVDIQARHINLVIGLDMSKSMFVEDVYPNRFEFAKEKFDTLLKELKNTRVAIIGFNTFSYLVSPFSDDYDSLDFLVKNMDTKNMKYTGTNFINLLKATSDIYHNNKEKALLIFTDGGEKKDFVKEIKYAKKHKIIVFIYAIGSDSGSILKIKKESAIDKQGNIKIFNINVNIKNLAQKSGGNYIESSLSKSDISSISYAIKSKFRASSDKNSVIKDKKELFYYPLSLALFFFFMANFSLMRSKP